MKKQDLFTLQGTLNSLKQVQHTKFGYVIVKNLRIIKPFIAKLQKNNEPSPELLEYDKERVELCRVGAKKDDKGNPVVKNNQFDIEDMPKLETDLKALREGKYKKAFEADQKKAEKFQKKLQEKINIDFYKIKPANLPDNLTAAQLESLDILIDGEMDFN